MLLSIQYFILSVSFVVLFFFIYRIFAQASEVYVVQIKSVWKIIDKNDQQQAGGQTNQCMADANMQGIDKQYELTWKLILSHLVAEFVIVI